MFLHWLVKAHSDHISFHHLHTIVLSYLTLIILNVNSTRGELFYVLPLHDQPCSHQQLPWSNISDLANATISQAKSIIITLGQANYTDIDIFILPSTNPPYVRNVNQDSIASLAVQVCFCDEQKQPDCSHDLASIHIKKGEKFTTVADLEDYK